METGLRADLTNRLSDLRQQGLFKTERLIISPQNSHIELADGYLLTRDVMIYFRANYAHEDDWRDWRVSPIFAESLAGLPPAYLMTAGFDPLRDEGRAYADAMSAAGVPVEYECFDGMIHGFIMMGGVIAIANEAVSRAAAVLARALA